MKRVFALFILLIRQVICQNFTEETPFNWNDTTTGVTTLFFPDLNATIDIPIAEIIRSPINDTLDIHIAEITVSPTNDTPIVEIFVSATNDTIDTPIVEFTVSPANDTPIVEFTVSPANDTPIVEFTVSPANDTPIVEIIVSPANALIDIPIPEITVSPTNDTPIAEIFVSPTNDTIDTPIVEFTVSPANDAPIVEIIVSPANDLIDIPIPEITVSPTNDTPIVEIFVSPTNDTIDTPIVEYTVSPANDAPIVEIIVSPANDLIDIPIPEITVSPTNDTPIAEIFVSPTNDTIDTPIVEFTVSLANDAPIVEIIVSPANDLIDIPIPEITVSPTNDIPIPEITVSPTNDIPIPEITVSPTNDIPIPEITVSPTNDISIPEITVSPPVTRVLRAIFQTYKPYCWRHSYGRGIGRPIHTCPDYASEQDGLLCYPPCRERYNGVGPVCWEKCGNITSLGFACVDIRLSERSCPWYDKCGIIKSSCVSCPPTYTKLGCLCGRFYKRSSYGRGAGSPLICSNSYDQGGAICYQKCNKNYNGVGPVCWQQCPSTQPYSCFASCSKTKGICQNQIIDIVKSAMGILKLIIGIPTMIDKILSILANADKGEWLLVLKGIFTIVVKLASKILPEITKQFLNWSSGAIESATKNASLILIATAMHDKKVLLPVLKFFHLDSIHVAFNQGKCERRDDD